MPNRWNQWIHVNAKHWCAVDMCLAAHYFNVTNNLARNNIANMHFTSGFCSFILSFWIVEGGFFVSEYWLGCQEPLHVFRGEKCMRYSLIAINLDRNCVFRMTNGCRYMRVNRNRRESCAWKHQDVCCIGGICVS